MNDTNIQTTTLLATIVMTLTDSACLAIVIVPLTFVIVKTV